MPTPLLLLADADYDGREWNAGYLRAQNFRVEEADDGLVALAKATALQPSLVCTELTLPRLDGFELCGRLKALEETRAIPLIALTADTCPILATNAAASSFDLVLEKPCLPGVLLSHVRDLIARSRRLREAGAAARHAAVRARTKACTLLARNAVFRQSAERRPFSALLHNNGTLSLTGGPRSIERRNRLTRPENGQERCCLRCDGDCVFIERVRVQYGALPRYEPAWFCESCGHRQFVRRLH